jgi:hypothetical protein
LKLVDIHLIENQPKGHSFIWQFDYFEHEGGAFKSLKNLVIKKQRNTEIGNPLVVFIAKNTPPPKKKEPPKDPPPQWRSNVCASMILNVTTVKERVHLIKCEL